MSAAHSETLTARGIPPISHVPYPRFLGRNKRLRDIDDKNPVDIIDK